MSSLHDRLAAHDTMQLLVTGSALALVTAASTVGGSYNFALFLFGIATYDLTAAQPWKTFVLLLPMSALLDAYRLVTRTHGSLVALFEVLILVLKAPVFVGGVGRVRERGGDVGVPWGNWQPPNLSMPGGFSGAPAPVQTHGQPAEPEPPRGGYQTIA
ncbi:hypothetical protein Q5752_002290 [Cryptotrichosporon argae]